VVLTEAALATWSKFDVEGGCTRKQTVHPKREGRCKTDNKAQERSNERSKLKVIRRAPFVCRTPTLHASKHFKHQRGCAQMHALRTSERFRCDGLQTFSCTASCLQKQPQIFDLEGRLCPALQAAYHLDSLAARPRWTFARRGPRHMKRHTHSCVVRESTVRSRAAFGNYEGICTKQMFGQPCVGVSHH